MNQHPNARRLDGLAAGLGDREAEAHIAGCAPCARYVEGLRARLAPPSEGEAEAFVASLAGELPPASQVSSAASLASLPALPSASSPEAAPSRRGLGPRARFIAAAAPLLAAAALLLLVLRPAPPAPPPPAPPRPGGAGPAADGGAVRFKGEVAVAIVRDRGGDQERLVHEASVRSGDRIRVEVSSSAGGPLLAGVLADDGTWLPLLEAPFAEAGTHFSERAARFDAEPTEGAVLAGRPDEVERARATRNFERVASLRLRYEPTP
jgi:hypothetical protein